MIAVRQLALSFVLVAAGSSGSMALAASNSVDLQVTGDITIGKTVQVGFGTDPLVSCVVGNYNPGHDRTAVNCSGLTQSTATSFHVVVLNS
jgi:hypothetical protein